MTQTKEPRTKTTGRTFGFWAGMLACFVLPAFALPIIFLNPSGPLWFHLAFHLIGIALCLLGIWLASRAAKAAPTRTLTVMSWTIAAALVVWMFGHTGELVTVLTHGGAHASPELFDDPTHSFFASFAVPGWMLSVLSIVVLLVSSGIRVAYRSLTGRSARRSTAV